MKTFEDVVAGRVACHKVWEDEHHLAILSTRPVCAGHTVVIKKRTVGYLFDLSAEEHAALWEAARLVATRLRATLGCERVCVAVVGWEVRHVHVHLIPTNRGGEFPPLSGPEAGDDELASIAEKIARG